MYEGVWSDYMEWVWSDYIWSGCGQAIYEGVGVVRLCTREWVWSDYIRGSGCGQTIFYLCLAGSRDWQWEDRGMCVLQLSFVSKLPFIPPPPPPPPPPPSPHTCMCTQAFCLPIIQIVYETLRDRKAGKTGRVTVETAGTLLPVVS